MTEVSVMPPIISLAPSDDVDEDVPFKVLNQDNLPMSVIGETILKPFGQEHQRSKPNVIVHPTRRVMTNLEELKTKPFAKSHGYINQNNNNPTVCNKNLRKNFSNSQGNLHHNNSSSKIKLGDLKNHLDAKFTKTLDAKLRQLQKEEKAKKAPPQIINEANRKPFVTTVKKGEFLEPPPEIASLIGIKLDDSPVKKEEKKLYSFSSHPRVLNRVPLKNVHHSRCEAASKAAQAAGSVIDLSSEEETCGTVGKKLMDAPLPYANLMFEKRVFRGSNYAPQNTPEWNPNFAYAKLLSRDEQGDGESAAARAAEARRRALARRKAKNQHFKSQLRLSSPPPVTGRKHEQIQTEQYLEEIFASPPSEDTCTQTDLFLERPVSPFYVPTKSGEDAETQIYPEDLFNFEVEVQPILDVLVGKTVEQALIEVLEEEELAALREQQRRFLEIRAAETCEVRRLEEREKRLVQEKDKKIEEMRVGQCLQKEMESRIAASILMQGYMEDLLPSVLEGLEADGLLVDTTKDDIEQTFMPWLVKEVTSELQDMVSSRDVLSDIVREILENRAEIYKALNKSPRSEEDEEGPTMDDIINADHLKLQNELKREVQNDDDIKEDVSGESVRSPDDASVSEE